MFVSSIQYLLVAMYHYDLEHELMMKAWQLLHELSEYNTHNQKLAVNLQNGAISLKVCYNTSHV